MVMYSREDSEPKKAILQCTFVTSLKVAILGLPGTQLNAESR